MTKIIAWCHLKNGSVVVNGRTLFTAEEGTPARDFVREAWRHLGISYPKFFKMDDYARLGFVAAQYLLSPPGGEPLNCPEDTAIVLSNSHGTEDTDRKFNESIRTNDQFFPSPAVFVYTLPNIMAGEISIRHQFTGENAFFVSSHFDAGWHHRYVSNLLETGRASCCLSGWIDGHNDHYDAFLTLVRSTDSPTETASPHHPEMLEIYYHT